MFQKGDKVFYLIDEAKIPAIIKFAYHQQNCYHISYDEGLDVFLQDNIVTADCLIRRNSACVDYNRNLPTL